MHFNSYHAIAPAGQCLPIPGTLSAVEAAALPEASADLRGLALGDSVAVDPHKWLYAPLEVGCVLVRDRQSLPDACSYTPP